MSRLIDRMRQRLARSVPHMPKREELAQQKWLAPIAHRFLSPELWRFTRRSVPRGVALGIFSGFIIPLGQIFLAAFLALPARANVPLAVLVTFVTNPFTVPFWIWVANRTGAFILRLDSQTVGSELARDIQAGTASGMDFGWFLQEAGVTAFGFVVMSVVGAAIGYLFASLFWRVWVGRKQRRRLARMRTPS